MKTNSKMNSARIVPFAFFILFLLCSGVLVTTKSTFAATLPYSHPSKVHMYFDCSKGSPAFQEYTVQNHLCPAKTDLLSKNTITPDNSVPGNCGDTYIYSEPSVDGTGVVTLIFGANSNIGPIIGGSALISGIGGPYAYPVTANNGFFSWAASDTFYLSTGTYTATLSGGTEVLIAGLFPTTCYFEGPYTTFTL